MIATETFLTETFCFGYLLPKCCRKTGVQFSRNPVRRRLCFVACFVACVASHAVPEESLLLPTFILNNYNKEDKLLNSPL